jgi:hypothetical protein
MTSLTATQMASSDVKNQLVQDITNVVGNTRDYWYSIVSPMMDLISVDSTYSQSIFVPVIIHPNKNVQRVSNVNPGIPFSLYDVAQQRFATTGKKMNFIGHLDIAETSSSEEHVHNAGNAVDISLVPYFATTGIVMSDYGPLHVLTPDYAKNLPDGHRTPLSKDKPFYDRKSNGYKTAYAIGSNAIATAKPDDEDKHTELFLREYLSTIGDGSLFLYEDLLLMDRVLYHVSFAGSDLQASGNSVVM